jgi:hypothetical protein
MLVLQLLLLLLLPAPLNLAGHCTEDLQFDTQNCHAPVLRWDAPQLV